MGRSRKAWLPNGTGKRTDARTGKELPGYYALWNEYPSGKRRHRSAHFTRRSDAQKFVTRWNAQAVLRQLDETVPISLALAAEEWIVALSDVAKTTVGIYESAVGKLIEFCGNIDTCTVTADHIRTLIDRSRMEVSEATAARRVRSVGTFFLWCVAQNYAIDNPVALTKKRPRNNIVRTKPELSHANIAALLAALNTIDQTVAVLIAATTGMDRGVITGITRGNVDLPARRFRGLARKKTGVENVAIIHDHLVPMLQQLCDERCADEPLLRGLSRQKDDKDWWKRATKAAGLDGVLFLDLRTYGINYVRRALGDRASQRSAGHSSPAISARHYYSINEDDLRQFSRQPLPGTVQNE